MLFYIPFTDFNNHYYPDLQGTITERIIPYCGLVPIDLDYIALFTHI